MTSKKSLACIIILIISASAVFYYITQKREYSTREAINTFFSKTKSIENIIISNIPIYTDFFTHKKEIMFRKYLLPYHIESAANLDMKRISNYEELHNAVKNNKIVAVESSADKLFYFYNVPDEHRYLSPKAYQCLTSVTERYQHTLKKYGVSATVKIAVSSALRIEQYQKKLIKSNKNAAIESSHSYGISFDIFYDDYYLVPPEIKTQWGTGSLIIEDIRRQQGFLLAHALRRQLRTVLAETLLALQNEGELYVILEKKQRCYHVTVRK